MPPTVLLAYALEDRTPTSCFLSSSVLDPPFPTVVSHGSFMAGGWRLCSFEPGLESLCRSFYRFYLRPDSVSLLLQEDLIVRLAFKVPLVAPGRATTVEFAFFLLRLLLPPSISPFASSSLLTPLFPLQPFAGSRVLSREIPSLPFAVHPPIIPNTENTVAALLLLLGYSRLLLFPSDFRS